MAYPGQTLPLNIVALDTFNISTYFIARTSDRHEGLTDIRYKDDNLVYSNVSHTS